MEQKKHTPSKRPSLRTSAWAAFSTFVALAIIAGLERFWLSAHDLPFIIGSFGASCVVVYAATSSPLGQPYNLVVGHMVSALVGVFVFQLVGDANTLSIALSVALAVFAMQMTRSIHPPGGATALIAVIGSDAIHGLGYWYVLFPVGAGAMILLAVAVIANNVPTDKRWPQFWHPW